MGSLQTLYVGVTAIGLGESLLIAGLLMQRKQRLRAEARRATSWPSYGRATDRVRLLNRRLLDAQHAERTSIARELHDDLGPRLAVLAMDLAALVNADSHVKT